MQLCKHIKAEEMSAIYDKHAPWEDEAEPWEDVVVGASIPVTFSMTLNSRLRLAMSMRPDPTHCIKAARILLTSFRNSVFSRMAIHACARCSADKDFCSLCTGVQELSLIHI